MIKKTSRLSQFLGNFPDESWYPFKRTIQEGNDSKSDPEKGVSNEKKKECILYSGSVKKVKANNDFDSGASECGTDKDCAFKSTGIQTEEVIDTVSFSI